ncbi:MAG: redoxin domain-containing protein [bacterium]|nr:redoxin domain-containing protein [bacterium]
MSKKNNHKENPVSAENQSLLYPLISTEPLIDRVLPDLEVEAYQDDEIKKLKLSDYAGKWLVMIFYPGDFTFVCPTELEEAAELYPQFKKLGAEVLSISTDSVHVHKAWHDQSPAIKKVKFPMVADPTGRLCRALGTYLEHEGVSLRGSFVIDPDQKIKAYEIHHNDIGRNSHELLRKVQAAKFIREHEGRVCPASWKPGDDTLKPGLDLVGKI